MERAQEHAICTSLRIYRDTGEKIGDFQLGVADVKTLVISRKELHHTLHQYTKDVGIDVEFGTKVVSYYETGAAGGVVLENGMKIEADVVLAADGVGSASWEIVTGQKNKATSSGFAIYRITYPLELAMKDPLLAKEYEDVRPEHLLIWDMTLIA